MSSVALMPTVERAAPVDWNRELNGAKMLLKSGLLPKGITAEAALFIILTGRDLGLSPIQSLRSINVIQGKVEVAADMSLGLFHRAGGKSHFVKLTDAEAVLRFSAPWLLEDHDESFTIKDAERAGLLSRQDNWKKFPKAMLRSRAITAGLKSIGFDPTAGVYDYGEIGGPEPTLVAEPEAEMADAAVQQARREEENAEDEAISYDVDALGNADQTAEQIIRQREALAMEELEEIMPSLAPNQQEFVREKLGDGANPVALLNAVKQKARL
jgi:hypothetical protein